MRLRYAAKTDVGMKRAHNEDYFSLIEEEHLFMVADGMGGHSSGEVASKLATETLGEFYERTRIDEDATWPYRLDHSLSFVENRLVCGIKLANLRIFEAANRELSKRGMGTTIVAAAATGGQLSIAHVGDSRAYRIRDGEITPLTRDHSLLEDYKDVNPGMTAEEERLFPHKNVITRALGLSPTVEVDVATHVLKPGDAYLLCTDGLSGLITDEEALRIAIAPATIERVVADLVAAANKNGGNDNITVLLLQCHPA